MMTKHTIVYADSRGAIRSVPLSALPEEAWTYLADGGPVAQRVLEAYERVPWIYRAVNLRAAAVAALPVGLLRGDTAIDEPATVLPCWPAVLDVLDAMEADRTLYGAAYLLVERNRLGRPITVRRLLPTTVRPEFSETDGLVGFIRVVQGRTVRLSLDDVVYSWVTTRRDELGPGYSPVAVALMAAGVLRSGDELVEAYFRRGAIRPTILSVDGVVPQEAERIQSWFSRLASGLQNSFRALALRSGVTIQTLGDTPDTLAMPELTDKKREDIATALGIPHSLLFSNAANYATARQDDLHFYDKTIMPEALAIEQALNRGLFDRLGLQFEFRPEQLEIYQSLEAEKAVRLAVLFDRGIITVNEFREQMGLVPLPADWLPVVPPPARQPAISGDLPDDAVRQELRRWRRMAMRRIQERHPERAAAFRTEIIPPALRAAIASQLEMARSPADVAFAFEVYP